MLPSHPPTVLVFAGNDPSGGAGLCADIQTLSRLGCHTAPILTCVTVQDTRNVLENQPLTGKSVMSQAETILADMPIAACKIGLLGSVEIIQAVGHILRQISHVPIILDPILAAGGGKSLSNQAIIQAMRDYLLPHVSVITPNSLEAKTLTQAQTLPAAATHLLALGCQFVCITGTHETTEDVVNTLYGAKNFVKSWHWQRLPYSYHGSGCTFAASVAGFLAQGQELVEAIYQAQQYTWHSLQLGYHPGKGQALPNRCPKYWL
jgi:hydroxymethylpyrimidine/phosphomethylpyrimidine kinase